MQVVAVAVPMVELELPVAVVLAVAELVVKIALLEQMEPQTPEVAQAHLVQTQLMAELVAPVS